MRKLAFLTTSLDVQTTDDELVYEPLYQLGYACETISWRETEVKWSEYAAVIIRSTWDYHQNLNEFLDVLQQIESQTRLANSLEIVRWNADKRYLQKLEARGVPIVPTIWSEGVIGKAQIQEWYERLQTNEVVLKPTVSASAEHTFKLERDKFDSLELISTFAARSLMVQPFMRKIVEEGEFSLFYFGGEYSHAILKTPKTSDFRVQEKHGGRIQTIAVSERLRAASEKILSRVESELLYARVDFVRDEADGFRLMELELIEPSMYLQKDENARHRFARVIYKWLKQEKQ